MAIIFPGSGKTGLLSRPDLSAPGIAAQMLESSPMERGVGDSGSVAMNRAALLRAMMLVFTIAGVASCQSAPPEGQGGSGGELQAQKTEILKQLNKGLAEIQKKQSCVQAANDPQALGACMQQDPKEFQAQKAEVLKRMSEGGADQQRQSCIKAANDPQALAACMQQGGGGRQ
jgi:hypothetical protein